MPNILEHLSAAGSFRAFLASMKIAGAEDVLSSAGPWTVFAPQDRAFRRLPAEQMDRLFADRRALLEFLSFHMLPGKITSAEVGTFEAREVIQGKRLMLRRGRMRVNGIPALSQDIPCANGVIHVVDRLLPLPPGGAW